MLPWSAKCNVYVIEYGTYLFTLASSKRAVDFMLRWIPDHTDGGSFGIEPAKHDDRDIEIAFICTGHNDVTYYNLSE